MGHLLGAVTQENLTNQIGVVQNEKRQGDNEPFGMVEYAQLEGLFPEGHPYRHSTIGSMADLRAATLDTVRDWFRDNYGPNNAVLVLAGDIDAAEARPLVERYFGDIARGPVNTPAAGRRADASRPGRPDHARPGRQHPPLSLVGRARPHRMTIRCRCQVARLRARRPRQLAARQSRWSAASRARCGSPPTSSPSTGSAFSRSTVDVKPGQDADAVSRRLDEIVADFIRTGPTEDEVRRAVMRTLSGRVQGLEQVGGFGGKAVALAEGMLYADDPDFYRTRLAAARRGSRPAQVRAAMQRWLTRPVYALRVDPGEREAYEEAPGVTGSRAGVRLGAQPAAALLHAAAAGRPAARAARRSRPRCATHAARRPARRRRSISPTIERARLSNGIQVVYARRTAVPVTRVAVEFDAGIAADPADRLGTQAMMLNLLEEGTTSLNSTQLAEAQERLGATIGTGASLDRTTVSLTALTPDLGAVARPARRRHPQSGLRAGARSSGSASSSSPASPPR